MKLRYIGMLLLIVGFATPYALRAFFPTLLYAAIPSTLICFWGVFLLILKPVGNGNRYNPYLKWASYAIWLNIVLTILSNLYIHNIRYMDIRSGVVPEISFFLGLLAKPVETIFDGLVPLTQVEQADGAILITQSFIRSLLTNFFNLIFFATLGVLAKIVKDKYQLRSDAASQRQ